METDRVVDGNASATPRSAKRERPAIRRASLYRAMERLLLVYLAAILAVMFVRGVRVTPDLFLIFGGIAALLVGRGWAFVRDWFPLVAILLAWQATRGLADQAGFSVHSDDLIAVERFLHLGLVPTVELQAALRGDGISLLDMATTFVYFAHFIIPLTVGFALWLKSRAWFHRYMLVLLVVSLLQFLTAIVLPAAPPRFAHQYGEALAVVDVARIVKAAMIWEQPTWIYANMNPNPVAAFPSLHAAYPLIALLAVRRVWPRLVPFFTLNVAAVWFSIVYLGHHYLVDAYAAAMYVAVIWWAVMKWWPYSDDATTVEDSSRLGGRPGAALPSQELD